MGPVVTAGTRAVCRSMTVQCEYVRSFAGPQPSPKQLEDIRHARVELTPGGGGISRVGREYLSPLLILASIATFPGERIPIHAA